MTVHQQEAVGEDWLEKMAQLADSQGTARPWTGIMGGWAAVYVMGIIYIYIYTYICIYIYIILCYMIGRLLSLNEFFF